MLKEKLTFLQRNIFKNTPLKIYTNLRAYFINRIINLQLIFRTLRLCQRFIVINMHAILRSRE
jgi:hypothetical protein